MLEILNNIELPLIVVGAALGMLSMGWFIHCTDQGDTKNRPLALFGFAVGLLMFFGGWAIPNAPEEEKPEPKPQEAAKVLFDECMDGYGSVNDTPDARLKCVSVVRHQLELYQIKPQPASQPRPLPTP